MNPSRSICGLEVRDTGFDIKGYATTTAYFNSLTPAERAENAAQDASFLRPVLFELIDPIHFCKPLEASHELLTQYGGLDKFLDEFDGMLKTVARTVGATVVSYDWHLIEIDEDNDHNPSQLSKVFSLPGNYELGAEIWHVDQERLSKNRDFMPYELPSDITSRVDQALKTIKRTHGWYPTDMDRMDQYTAPETGEGYYMTLDAAQQAGVELTLVDIEPRLSIHR